MRTKRRYWRKPNRAIKPKVKTSCFKSIIPATNIRLCEENRFSIFVRTLPDLVLLLRWQAWFKARGIETAIASGKSGTALYREGLIEVKAELKK